MKQYCRWCANCIDGDALYCTYRQKVLSEKKVKSQNRCPYFSFVNMDVFDCSKEYKPRIYKTKHYDGQMNLFEFGLKKES